MDKIKNETKKLLSEQYSDDVLDIDKCKALRDKFIQQKEYSEKQLSLSNSDSNITKVVVTIEENVTRIEECVRKSEESVRDLETELNEVEETRKKVEEYIDKLNVLQTTLQYLKVIQRIESLSSDIQKELSNKDDERCVTLFANLCEISRNLSGSSALNLKKHLADTLLHWHDLIKDKLVIDYNEVLKVIKWPFTSANFNLQTPSQTSIHKLQIIAEYLLQIELPEESILPVLNTGVLADFTPLCLPIHYLVLPLRKRFLYHFQGGRQTNRIDKPEWYFTQILTWIRDHIDFVSRWIQPIVDKLGLHHIDVKLELMRGLVQLAVEKLYSDLPNLQYDDFTFSHSVDEALGFEKELRESYSYPTSQPTILAVLTQAQIFMKWLAMEKKYAVEKMDVMLSSPSGDAFHPIASDIEDLKVTTCSDNFVTLLQTITERYEALPQPGHRLQFLELQLELLDDFRVRLLQLVSRESECSDIVESKVPMIANSVYYVENVLSDWGAMLHYLNLFYYKNQLANAEASNVPMEEFDGSPGFEFETETVFADTLSLYRHMRKDLLCTLAESVIRETKAKTFEYRRENWSCIQVQKELRCFSLTPSACPMFEILSRRLHQLQKSLAGKLFAIVWRFIAQQLDIYLFDELVLDNRFNDGGAMQLRYDLTRNLYPLFSQFSEKPEHYFTHLNESSNLLNITKGSALLLRETLVALEGSTGVEDRRGQALREIGVVKFEPSMAIAVLNKRTDITTKRMDID